MARDTYRYKLKKGNTVVKFGITNDPDRRLGEYESSSYDFTAMDIEGPKVTRNTAEEWEKEKIANYEKQHKGQKPKYNKKLG